MHLIYVTVLYISSSNRVALTITALTPERTDEPRYLLILDVDLSVRSGVNADLLL